MKNLIKDDEKMRGLVSCFYHNVLADDRIRHFFENADREKLENKQTWFLATLMMGEKAGTADYMAQTHRALVQKQGLRSEHFDATLECLDKAMTESQIPAALANRLLVAAKALKGAVLNEMDVIDAGKQSSQAY